jgi:hypothetical protein
VDVPIDRQDRLSVLARSTDGTIDWQLTVVDQLQGAVVARQTLRCLAGEPRQVSLSLPKMLGVLTIMIEITKSTAPAGLKIESVKIA